jgi:hypothetical protein
VVVADFASKDVVRITSARDRLVQLLGSVFPDELWLITPSTEEYTAANKSSQWANELHKAETDFLGPGGEAKLTEWLGTVHYVAVTVTNRNLFSPGSVRDNAGWRLSWLAMPAPRVCAVGLAHHYQGTPAQDKLGRASNFLFDVLEAQSKRLEPAIDLGQLGRKIRREDWEEGGLTSENVDVAGTPWPGNLPLRFARNTTTKKVLSTFITIRSLPMATTDHELTEIATVFHSLMKRMVA